METDRLFDGQIVDGSLPETTIGVVRDSRVVQPNQIFISMGSPEDQPKFIAEAHAAGGVVVSERNSRFVTATVPHARWAFARASAAAHGVDRECPPLIAATGTKGKSTVVHFAWAALGPGAARVGTIGWHDGTVERPNSQTTPPPEELHRFLANLSPGCQGVALEISSHGADQHRLAGLSLQSLAWIGVGHDHLDYHGSQSAYIAAKLRAIRWLSDQGTCVVNADDDSSSIAAHAADAVGAQVIWLGFGSRTGYGRTAARLTHHDGTYRLELRSATYSVSCPLPGNFNAWNAAAAALMASSVGVPIELALDRIRRLDRVPGRLERLAEAPITYVDYAHTAESIHAVIQALRSSHPGRTLAFVFGCGGDRDRSKRPAMGLAASEADIVIITTDNSRSENPVSITNDILAGIVDTRGVHVEPDRGSAILLARRLVGTEGIVVIAGKGHETTQTIGGRIFPWDDRAFVGSLGRQPIAGGS